MTVYYISTMQSSNLVVSIVEHVYRMIALLLHITSRNSPRTLIMSFICNLFVFPPKIPSPFFLYTSFRMMQSSKLVVSIVEHVYRMIALLLYITSRNSPRWGHLGLFLEVVC